MRRVRVVRGRSRRARRSTLHELDAASNNRVDEHPRPHRAGRARARPGRTQGVHPRRGPHALAGRVERAAEDAGGAARPRRVRRWPRPTRRRSSPTIRSRTQHFEFHLLPADVLAEHVRWVIDDAGLDVADEAVDHVVRQGGGSARDTLSALDQAVAAGGVVARRQPRRGPRRGDLRRRRRAAPSWRWPTPCRGGRDPRTLGRGAAQPAARRVPASAWARPVDQAHRGRPRAGEGVGRAPRRPGRDPGPRGARRGAGRDAPGHRPAHRARGRARPPDPAGGRPPHRRAARPASSGSSGRSPGPVPRRRPARSAPAAPAAEPTGTPAPPARPKRAPAAGPRRPSPAPAAPPPVPAREGAPKPAPRAGTRSRCPAGRTGTAASRRGRRRARIATRSPWPGATPCCPGSTA